MLSRRDFIRNASSLLLIPAYVKAESLMKVVVPKGPFDDWYYSISGTSSVYLASDPGSKVGDFTSIGLFDNTTAQFIRFRTFNQRQREYIKSGVRMVKGYERFIDPSIPCTIRLPGNKP